MTGSPFRVVVTARRLHSRAVALLEAAGAHVDYLDDVAEVRRRLAVGDVDAMIVRTMEVDAAMIAASPRLRVISRHGAGHETVDVEAATRAGIPVLVARGANAVSVAEMTIGLVLAVARQIPTTAARVKSGAWDRTQPGLQLRGRSIGLVGFGAIGRTVATIALGVGMTVRVFDPQVTEVPPPIERCDDLDTLFKSSQILSLHCPLTPATAGLVDARRLALLPANAILVNTARGGLVDEAALLAALDAGRLRGAALDTLTHEPPEDANPLVDHPDVIVTPHIGGNTDAALADVAIQAVAGMLAVLQGLPVDPARCANSETLAVKGN